jgi:MoaA/NifB/PqqE/SkfB family radical SAM enzyme
MFDFIGRLATASTHKIYALPVLVLMPHSRCNCRCVMCDIWKANQEKREISAEELERHLEAFKRMGLKRVALSGGEALMHSNLWKLCEQIHSIGAKISLLSTGVTLSSHAKNVVMHCDDVIVSLDGSPGIHNKIRNIPQAFEKLREGIQAIKALEPSFRVTGRTVLQKQNFRDFINIVRTARDLGLDQVSFLGADVSTEAFNRPDPWTPQKISEVSLTDEETVEMEQLLKESFVDLNADYKARFIAERPSKMMEIVQHYKGINRKSDFPRKKCNAPWVSAVIESNGDVMPCFFQPAYGNIQSQSLEEIINSKSSVAFRKGLDVESNPICRQCVCSLHLGLTQSV